MRLFTHCGVDVPYVRQLAAVMPGLERYAERALVLAQRGDVVCVPNSVDRDYLAFLVSLGLGPDPEDVIVPPLGATDDVLEPLCRRILGSPATFERLVHRTRTSGPVDVHPFIASASHFELASELGRVARTPVRVVGGGMDLINRADRKDCMRIQARALGLPIADGEIVRLPAGEHRHRDVTPLRDTILRYVDRTGRVLVRGATGASGSSTFIVDRSRNDLASAAEQITRHPGNDVYLVEVMVDAVTSPNVQIHIAPADGAITCLGVTEQRWSRPLAHAGELVSLYRVADRRDDPLVDRLRRVASRRGIPRCRGVRFRRISRSDHRGAAGALCRDQSAHQWWDIPLALFERLNERRRHVRQPTSAAFVSASVETSARNFAELQQLIGPLLYTPEGGVGAVPYLSTMLPLGKYLTAVFGASQGDVVRMLGEVQRASAGMAQTLETSVS